MATIACLDCRAIRRRCPRNTKYCRECRLLRDIRYFKTADKRCKSEGCSHRYVPTAAADPFCGECSAAFSSHRGHCRLCKQDDQPLEFAGVMCCVHCIRATEHRARIIVGLEYRQTKRLEANADGPPPGIVEESASRRRAEEADLEDPKL